MTRDTRWALPVSQPGDRWEAFRDPVRATIIGASALFIVGARLPWINAFLPYRPDFEVSGFDHAGDGAITFVLAVLTLGWALTGLARSRIPAVVVVPFVVGVVTLIISRVAFQNADIFIASYVRLGGGGTISIGLWLTALAAIVMTVAGVLHVYRLRRVVSFRIAFGAGDIGAVVGGVAGGVAGFVASTAIVAQFVTTDRVGDVASAQVLAAIALGFVGSWVGVKLGRVAFEAFRSAPPRA